jgi:hemoglobin-like flavoprotein
MSDNLNLLHKQQKALRQVELIIPQLSQELIDIIVVVEEQLLPAVNELNKICPTETTQRIKEEIKNGLSKAISQIAASSGSIDSIQEAVDDLKQQLTSLRFITEEE